MNRYGMIMVAFLLCASRVWTGEASAITANDFVSASPEAHGIWSFLASDMAFNAWLWLVTSGVALITGWLGWKGSRKEQALKCLAAGVRETYEEYVRVIKLANADGKLSDEERREALRLAIARGTQYARTEGIDLLKTLGKDLLPVIVDGIVRRIKGEAVLQRSPLSPPPLPDLAF